MSNDETGEVRPFLHLKAKNRKREEEVVTFSRATSSDLIITAIILISDVDLDTNNER